MREFVARNDKKNRKKFTENRLCTSNDHLCMKASSKLSHLYSELKIIERWLLQLLRFASQHQQQQQQRQRQRQREERKKRWLVCIQRIQCTFHVCGTVRSIYAVCVCCFLFISLSVLCCSLSIPWKNTPYTSQHMASSTDGVCARERAPTLLSETHNFTGVYVCVISIAKHFLKRRMAASRYVIKSTHTHIHQWLI